MSSSFFLRAATLACVLAGTVLQARAEETVDELKARMQNMWEPWKGCEAGSWVQMRSTTKNGGKDSVSEFRQTLVSRNDKGLTIRTQNVKRSQDAEGKQVVEMGEPQESVLPPAQSAAWEEFKELRREDLDVAGKKIPCRVIDATYVFKPTQGAAVQAGIRMKMTLWISPEVKEMGGLVKTECDSDTQQVMGSWSTDMKLVETGKEVKIGDAKVKCSVYRFGSVSGKEEMASSGEFWRSEDVPFGYVKVKSDVNYAAGGTKIHSTSEMDITEMQIVRLKKE